MAGVLIEIAGDVNYWHKHEITRAASVAHLVPGAILIAPSRAGPGLPRDCEIDFDLNVLFVDQLHPLELTVK